jgi:hypothetical protein
MYRVYLDWHIISGFKRLENNDDLKGLKELLDKNPNDILIPYSPAHIQDLLKGSENTENIQLIRTDLNLLDEITKQNCIQFDFKKNMAHPTIGSAHLLFDGYYETSQATILHPDYLENLFKDTPFPSMGKLMTTTWKMTPTGIDFKKFEENPESKEIYATYFTRTKESDNMYNLMVDFSEFYSDLNQKPEIYKKMTKIFREVVGIDPKWVSNLKEPLTQLNDILGNSKIGFNFDRLSTIESNAKNELINNNFLKFSLEYAGLDMSGFHPDSLSNKNLFSNFTNDSHHAFYAGHCDYFVSFEKKLLKKAQALYRKYNVETKTMLPSDFIKDISNNLKNSYDASYLINSINKEIEKGYIEEINKHDFKDARMFLYRPQIPILAYFNFLYLKQDKDDRFTIFLRHIYKNFSLFTFYSEIESIVNKLTSLFGIDINNKISFDDDDKEKISNDQWLGRVWWVENFLIQLFYDKLSLGIQLTLEQITDEYLEELKNKH